MVKVFLLSFSLLLMSCANQSIVLTSTCPDRPKLPEIKAEALQNISKETYRKLVERELLLKRYARILEVNCARK